MRTAPFSLFVEMGEHEQADSRRQIAVLALDIDVADNFRQMNIAVMPNLLEAVPEGIFETDAGPVAADHDRPFDHSRSQRHSARLRPALDGCDGNSVRAVLVRLRPRISQGGLKAIIVLHFDPQLSTRPR